MNKDSGRDVQINVLLVHLIDWLVQKFSLQFHNDIC